MGCEQLHEGFFSDLIDVISGIKEIRKEKKDRKAIAGYTSLAKATSNLICVFPVLLSRNIPIGTAQIVTKACERDDTSMLQILFSALSISQASDGIEYVKSVHRNMKLGSGVDVDEFMRVMNNALMTESSIVDSQAYDLIRADMKNINYTLPDSISERGLNEYSLIKEGYNYLLLESSMSDIDKSKDIYGDLTLPPLKSTDPDEIIYTTSEKIDKMLNAASWTMFKDIFTDFTKVITYEPFQDPNNPNNMIQPPPTISLFSDDKLNTSLLNFAKMQYKTNDNSVAINNLKDFIEKIQNRDIVSIDDYNMSDNNRAIFRKYVAMEMQENNLSRKDLIDLYEKIDRNNDQDTKNRTDNILRRIAEKRADDNAERLAKMDKHRHILSVTQFRHQMRRDHVQDKKDKARAYQQYYSDLSNRNTKMLVDTDVKKANEMMPTLLNVSFTQMVNKGDKKYETPVAVSMIIGVKAKMVPLDSGDIINRIINKNKDKNFFIKFFRSTTREISFFKDLVFSVDKAKSDALSFSKKSKSSGIWKLLERRSGKSKAARLMGTQNSAMAISTLIITAEEVETIKKIANINVEDPSVMAPIMQAYNLMGFGIVDDTLQTFKIMRDNGENYFETYAYTALEKELADNTKAVANLVAASNRK